MTPAATSSAGAPPPGREATEQPPLPPPPEPASCELPESGTGATSADANDTGSAASAAPSTRARSEFMAATVLVSRRPRKSLDRPGRSDPAIRAAHRPASGTPGSSGIRGEPVPSEKRARGEIAQRRRTKTAPSARSVMKIAPPAGPRRCPAALHAQPPSFGGVTSAGSSVDGVAGSSGGVSGMHPSALQTSPSPHAASASSSTVPSQSLSTPSQVSSVGDQRARRTRPRRRPRSSESPGAQAPTSVPQSR